MWCRTVKVTLNLKYVCESKTWFSDPKYDFKPYIWVWTLHVNLNPHLGGRPSSSNHIVPPRLLLPPRKTGVRIWYRRSRNNWSIIATHCHLDRVRFRFRSRLRFRFDSDSGPSFGSSLDSEHKGQSQRGAQSGDTGIFKKASRKP